MAWTGIEGGAAAVLSGWATSLWGGVESLGIQGDVIMLSWVEVEALSGDVAIS